MLLPIIYFGLITLGEFVTVYLSPQLGILLYSSLLVAILLHGATSTKIQKRRFLLVMALVPLIRIISTTLPLGGRPLLEWHITIGALLFVAIFFTVRAVQLDAKRIGITSKNLPLQIIISLLGVPLGYIEYLILRPAPLISTWSLVAFLDAAFVLVIFTGLLEEVIFRGLMQEVTIEMMGIFGIIYSSVVFMILHLGYKSISDLLFVFGVAVFFGLIVAKSHSIVGVTLMHGVINISLYLLCPLAAIGMINIPGITNQGLYLPGALTPGPNQPTPVEVTTPLPTETPIAITPQPVMLPFDHAENIRSTPQTQVSYEERMDFSPYAPFDFPSSSVGAHLYSSPQIDGRAMLKPD